MKIAKRLTVRFDERLWNFLVKLAEKQKTSVGNLVRAAVRKHLTHTT